MPVLPSGSELLLLLSLMPLCVTNFCRYFLVVVGFIKNRDEHICPYHFSYFSYPLYGWLLVEFYKLLGRDVSVLLVDLLLGVISITVRKLAALHFDVNNWWSSCLNLRLGSIKIRSVSVAVYIELIRLPFAPFLVVCWCFPAVWMRGSVIWY